MPALTVMWELFGRSWLGNPKGNHLTTPEEFTLKGTSQKIKWTPSGRQNNPTIHCCI